MSVLLGQALPEEDNCAANPESVEMSLLIYLPLSYPAPGLYIVRNYISLKDKQYSYI